MLTVHIHTLIMSVSLSQCVVYVYFDEVLREKIQIRKRQKITRNYADAQKVYQWSVHYVFVASFLPLMEQIEKKLL